jgi:hypothetical protein
MWKLNKSIAKELLPTQPVDFPIDPWWGVCLVNFTIEEFKVRFAPLSICCTYHNMYINAVKLLLLAWKINEFLEFLFLYEAIIS